MTGTSSSKTPGTANRPTGDSLRTLRAVFRGSIRESVAIGPMTSFATGGTSAYLFVPVSEADVSVLVPWLERQGIDLRYLLPGANMLVDDAGFHGAMIDLRRACSEISYRTGAGDTRLVTAGAGIRLAELGDFCVRNEIAGLEEFAGIPGSLGGALVETQGEQANALRGRLRALRVLAHGGIASLSPDEAAGVLARRNDDRCVILSGTFEFHRGSLEELLRARRRALLKRAARVTLNVPRAGVVFQDEPDATADDLLIQAGCAGVTGGGAMTMDAHPNIVVNRGKATASEIYGVIREMQKKVKQSLGRGLTLRVRLAGFGSPKVAEAG